VFEVQIAAGIAALSEQVPDFRELVDANVLDMSHTDLCVLGQVGLRKGWGHYFTVCSRLGWESDPRVSGGVNAVDLGFIAHDQVDEATLTAEWKVALAAM